MSNGAVDKDKVENTKDLDIADFLRKLANKFDKLKTIEIHTVVSELEVSHVGESDWQLRPSKGVVKGLCTTIDMFEADIKETIHPEFADKPDDPVVKRHQENVDTSRGLFEKNLTFVANLLKQFTKPEQG